MSLRILLLFLPLWLYSKPFKVATYNVENLFDAVCQGSEYDDYLPGKHCWSKEMVEVKLNHTAEVICDLNADIIGLQEIENGTILEQLRVRLKEVGCNYPYASITHTKESAIQVALLSKFSIRNSYEVKVREERGIRNILEVEVAVEKHPLTLFVNHWKSKSYNGYESKRIPYAEKLQSRIATFPPEKAYIILGDFNSDYNAYETLEEHIDDTHGKTALSDVLQTKVGDKLVTEEEIITAPRGVHLTLWQELPVRERWSLKYYGKTSSADQIILPSTLFDGRGVEYVNNSFQVFKPDYLFTKEGYIYRWKVHKKKHSGKGYSDHLPVYAYFDTVPYKIEKKPAVEEKSIEDLYQLDALKYPVLMKDVVVVFKRGNHAVVKQRKDGRGIFIFRCAGELKEGDRYDLIVGQIHDYDGLKEITSLERIEKKGSVDTAGYSIKGIEKTMQQNEVIRGIEGIYRDNHLYWEGKVMPIYFKKRELIPQNGSRLKINYAHLGYYKGLQIVIYDKKDFKILE